MMHQQEDITLLPVIQQPIIHSVNNILTGGAGVACPTGTDPEERVNPEFIRKPYKCNFCDKIFSCTSNRKNHEQKLHIIDPEYI